MLLLRLVTVGGPAASRHDPHRLAQRKAQRSDGLFRFLALSGESFSTGVGLGEISGQQSSAPSVRAGGVVNAVARAGDASVCPDEGWAPFGIVKWSFRPKPMPL
ncbi:hypothetical protein [Streptomyces sp. NPDC018972]|uniref:hypothetical protein n=1 Tax=Streptomyces sp. NPDC018972 TaxID=3365060 RepID=UPI0037ADA3EA